MQSFSTFFFLLYLNYAHSVLSLPAFSSFMLAISGAILCKCAYCMHQNGKWKHFFSTMQWYGCSLRVARDGYRLRKFSYNLVTRVCFYCVLHLHICIWCCLHVFLCCLCILYSYTIFLGATHAKDIIL